MWTDHWAAATIFFGATKSNAAYWAMSLLWGAQVVRWRREPQWLWDLLGHLIEEECEILLGQLTQSQIHQCHREHLTSYRLRFGILYQVNRLRCIEPHWTRAAPTNSVRPSDVASGVVYMRAQARAMLDPTFRSYTRGTVKTVVRLGTTRTYQPQTASRVLRTTLNKKRLLKRMRKTLARYYKSNMWAGADWTETWDGT